MLYKQTHRACRPFLGSFSNALGVRKPVYLFSLQVISLPRHSEPTKQSRRFFPKLYSTPHTPPSIRANLTIMSESVLVVVFLVSIFCVYPAYSQRRTGLYYDNELDQTVIDQDLTSQVNIVFLAIFKIT